MLSLLLLVAVDVGGLTVNGARRWLDVGSFTMQPSELAKLGLLLVLAQVLGSDRSLAAAAGDGPAGRRAADRSGGHRAGPVDRRGPVRA